MKKITLAFVLSLLVSVVSFAQVDRSQFPKAGPAPVIKIGEAETFTLDNGLKVFVVENDKLPRVSFTLVLERDPLFEGDKAGLTGFVGQMMMAGTTSRTKDQIDQEVDFIGADLGVSATSISASSLKKHQGKILDLMSDVLYNPVFPADELDKLKKQSLTGLATSKDEPGAISSRLSSAMVYGKEHPYGEVTTETSLGNVNVEDVKTYYNTFFKPNIAYLAIVGDMSKSEAEEVVKKYFGKWKAGDVPKFTYNAPVAASKTVVGLVDRSSSVQTVIDIAQPIELTLGDADYISSRVLNQIFGGGSSSRLFTNLREDKGYTYGAYSSLAADKLIGQFSANASVRTDVTDSAVVEFIYEINRLVEEGVTQEELDKAKASLAGSFGRSLESPATIANFALNIERYDLPADYYETYLQKMNALTVADINKTADNLIDPSKLYITVVGNGTEIKDKLAQFGEVIMYDNMGFPAKEMAAVDANMTSDKVLENYITAIGGKSAASAIKAAKFTMAAEIMGQQLTIEQVFDNTNMRYMQNTLVGGNVMQSSVIKDGKGVVKVQGQSIDMTDEQIDAAKLETFFLPELYYGSMGYTLTLDGIKDVEGTPAYKIIVATPLGSLVNNYYSVDSGLKIKNENPVSGDTFYSDYQEKNGVMVPMAMTIKSAMIPVPLEAKVVNIELNPELTESDFN
ncbi:putative Zn-dependent peptidase [Algoriphagus ratkowskyi]|uniref:Insulinase family protein n=1 Tax=Algoriphagus ratkowskyi TaxID=57028 RepID=A0A2W7RJ18_9BACT|nr:pitrilysin family protein [Algoriphagus ratkowskyi]PZX50735.1 putative Zn-dependent peptidase [Algoriphagus ratkowskyi]TXD75779.1 insulinase family protein [Algoriphagus ratkowskyi]